MKILLPVAAPVRYNPAHYLKTAFEKMGHEAEVIDQGAFYKCGPGDADLFVGVDSGGPLNFPPDLCHKAVMWFIDSRRNSGLTDRQPDDDQTAIKLLERGGIVFQAQRQDADRLKQKVDTSYHNGVIWLPLAADPDVWSDQPRSQLNWKTVFVGNCYDEERLTVINTLSDEGLLHWPGIEGAIMEEGAAAYRQAFLALNVPSWLGTPICYDVNMRVFEALSCGRPLITNALPTMKSLGILEGEHAFTYPTPVGQQERGESARNVLRDVRQIISRALDEPEELDEMGRRARHLIVSRHTYWHRAQTILFMFESFMGGKIA